MSRYDDHLQPPDEPEQPCVMCGEEDVENCICPECPVCGCQGDPWCYESHGLIQSDKQKINYQKHYIKWMEAAASEAEYELFLEEYEKSRIE